MPNRTDILAMASNVSDERDETHGDFTHNMAHTSNLIAAYLDGKQILDPHDAPVILALVKLSRIRCGNAAEVDHYVDAANYIAQAGAMATALVDTAPIAPGSITRVTSEELDQIRKEARGE